MQDFTKNSSQFTAVLNLCLERDVHFAAYKLPSQSRTTMVIQKSSDVLLKNQLNEYIPSEGFLIAPFSKEKNETWLIKPDMVIHDTPSPQQYSEIAGLPPRRLNSGKNRLPRNTEKEEYIKLIGESINHIKAGDFEKVVLSRVKSIKGNFRTRIATVFSTLCDIYPNAFVYLFYVKDQCWTGATPEPFICSENDMLKTVSLAGTRSFHESDMDIRKWNKKELQEQEYVTLHIEKILKNYNISKVIKTGPYVAKAGNLLHLRTDFTFPADDIGQRLPELITSLHPTPAVCGMSTGSAMDFITTGEKHNRSYYAGFLGPIGLTEKIRLYVNLRCMQVYDDRLVLYIGGGITHDSVPEDEWEETEMKAETLLSALKIVG